MPARKKKEARRRRVVPAVRRAARRRVLDKAARSTREEKPRAKARPSAAPVRLNGSSRSHGLTKDECYTPALYMQLVRDVLKRIDLDPASTAVANLVVLAVRFFTMLQNGLRRRWRARAVWMNPPYSNPAPWSRKLLEAYNAGDVKEAIALFNSDTGAKWFHPLAQQAWRCEPYKRIKFYGPSTKGTTGWHPSTFFYLGSNPERFAAVFSKIGRIVPPAHVTQGVTQGRTCAVCSRLLSGRRADSDTCSNRCRQRRYRLRTACVVLEAPAALA